MCKEINITLKHKWTLFEVDNRLYTINVTFLENKRAVFCKIQIDRKKFMGNFWYSDRLIGTSVAGLRRTIFNAVIQIILTVAIIIINNSEFTSTSTSLQPESC